VNEVFLKEFLDDYTSLISKFEPFGIHPDLTLKILTQVKTLISLEFAADNLSILNSEIKRIEKQRERLTSILDDKDEDKEKTCQPPRHPLDMVGRLTDEDKKHKAFFPLIAKDAPEDFYGFLESVSVNIGKATDTDKFIIVPSEKEIEKKISEQCTNSWRAALELSTEYIKKPYKYHEVVIYFEKKEGFYEGSSLGIALTLSFLEQLLKFYNPTYIIKIKEQTAFTGGMTESGKVLPIGEEIIKQKIKAVFFSEMNTFVIPKCEEAAAKTQLTEFKKNYPNRNLKLIPAEDIADVINRRDVVDIRKQKLIVRTGKIVKKNWVSAVVTVLLAILFAFLFVMDFDDNPTSLTTDGNALFVKNKNGKVLWTKKGGMDIEASYNERILFSYCRIIDIDGDGENEVLYRSGEEANNPGNRIGSKLVCYNKDEMPLWTYTFSDSVQSEREILKPFYGLSILDTASFNNKNCLILFTSNTDSYSSAILKIDIQNGKRLPGTLWCAGFTVDGLIKDVDNDGKRDILAVGVDNGFEDIVIFAFDIDTLTSVRPTTKEYTIKGFPEAKFKAYIRLAKTDYDNYLGIRTSGIEPGRFYDKINEGKYMFYTTSSDDKKPAHLWIKFDYNLKDFDIVVDNRYRVIRDSLVAHGKLNLPYTDTKEYVDIFRSKILYWKDGKWVKREMLD
jgi:hypothetical protein